MRVDRMSDVGVKLHPAVTPMNVSAGVVHAARAAAVAVFVEPASAAVTEAGAEMILLRAARAMVAKLARRHGEEKPVGPLDQLDVADDEGVVEGERAEGLEPARVVAAQVDAHFGELHKNPELLEPLM